MHNKSYSANLLDFMSSSEPISEIKKNLEKEALADKSTHTSTKEISKEISTELATRSTSLPANVKAEPQTKAPTVNLQDKSPKVTNKIKNKKTSEGSEKQSKVKKQKNSTLLKIGHVAKLLDLNTSVLRFWEDEFEELNPLRTETGQRLYSSQDIAIAKRLKKLLHENGLTLEGAKKLLKKSTLPKGSAYIAPKTGKVKALSLKKEEINNEFSHEVEYSKKEHEEKNFANNSSISNTYTSPDSQVNLALIQAEQEKKFSFLKAIEAELLEIKKKLI